MTVTIYVERENPQTGEYTEHEIECEFDYHRAYRGKCDSLCGVRGAGQPLEPDEPAYLEFVNATCEGKPFDLTDDETAKAEEKAWDEI